MTAVVVLKEPGNIYLASDTAETPDYSVAADEWSSFGELQQLDDGCIQESSCKLLRLPGSVVVGIAGDLRNACRLLQLVTNDLASGRRDLGTILEELAPAFVGCPRDDRFQLIFAASGESNPELLRFDTDTGFQLEPGQEGSRSAWFLGSLSDRNKRMVAGVLDGLSRQTWSQDQKLVAMLVYLQSLGVHHRLPSEGVAGAFFGARLDGLGVHWQDDIIYVLCEPGALSGAPTAQADGEVTGAVGYEPPGLEKVRCIVRSEGWIVTSSIVHEPRLFVPATLASGEIDWHDVLEREFSGGDHPTLTAARYYAFVRKDAPKAVIVARKSPAMTGSDVQIEQHSGRYARLGVSDRVVAALEQGCPTTFQCDLVLEE